MIEPVAQAREALRVGVAVAGEQFVAAALQGRDPPIDLARADHRLHARVGGDPPLSAAQRGEASVVGDRAVVGDGDEHEGCVPALANRSVDRFRVLAGRVRGRQLVGARRTRLEGQHGKREQEEDSPDGPSGDLRPTEGCLHGAHQAHPAAVGTDPPTVDVGAEQV